MIRIESKRIQLLGWQMRGLFWLIGIMAVAVLPVGQASADSITDDLVINFTSGSGFTFTDLSFASTSSSTTTPGNFLQNVSLGPYNPGFAQVIEDNITLNTSESYALSYTAGNFTGSSNISPSATSPTSFSIASNGVSGSFFDVSLTLTPVAPVPLPASFPLFALALLSLGLFGFHAAAHKKRNANFCSEN